MPGLLNMKRGELPLAVMSALFFFLVLCGYFFLRPVREAMGVARGDGRTAVALRGDVRRVAARGAGLRGRRWRA